MLCACECIVFVWHRHMWFQAPSILSELVAPWMQSLTKKKPCLWRRWTSCSSSNSCSRPQGTQTDSFSSLPCSFTALADWHSCLSVCVWSLASSLSQCGERAGRSRSGEMNYSAPAKCQAPHWVPHVRLTEKQAIDHEAWGVLDLQTQTLEPDHWNFNYKLCHSFPTYLSVPISRTSCYCLLLA